MTAAPTAKPPALAKRENQSDVIAGVDLSGENNPVAPILIDLAQRDTSNKSSEFATNALKKLGQVTDLLARSPHRVRQPGGAGGARCSRRADRTGLSVQSRRRRPDEHRFVAEPGRRRHRRRRGCPICAVFRPPQASR